jgi:hypothetical protein
MNNISHSLGLPTKFIRYNPDNKKYSQEQKHQALLETIYKNKDLEYIENIEPIYLFY